jgi:hypothetical protein
LFALCSIYRWINWRGRYIWFIALSTVLVATPLTATQNRPGP